MHDRHLAADAFDPVEPGREESGLRPESMVRLRRQTRICAGILAGATSWVVVYRWRRRWLRML